jgi:outer membrane protein TolC
VSGRDFVSEHLRAERSLVQLRVTAANAHVQEAQRMRSVGLGDASKLDEARARLGGAQAMVEMFRQKLDIRQKFLTGALDAIETDLRGLEVEATQRRAALAPQVELAREDERQTTAKVRAGLAQQIDALQATTRRLQLEVELTDADMQLALVQQKIAQHRAGR